MWKLLGATITLFVLGVYVGFVAPISTDASAVNGENTPVFPYLSSVTYTQVPQPQKPLTVAAATIENPDVLDARFAGMLLHVRWLLERKGETAVSEELKRLDRQVLSLMDDVSDDMRDLREDVESGGGLPAGFVVDGTGTVTTGVWQGTPILDAYINDVLTLGAGSSFANNIVTPNAVLSSGQVDEYCLTYEATGTTFEWQTCGGGGGLSSSDIDTSLELAAIITDETGTGALVFGTSPTFTGTVNAAAATLSSTLTMSGTDANIALGSNFLSGDGGDEGIFVDGSGNVGIGTVTPVVGLNISSNGGQSQVFIDRYSNDVVAPGIATRKARGTSAAPLAVLAEDILMNFSGRGYNGTSFTNAAASVRAYTSENWSSGSNGSYLSFWTTTNGSSVASIAERMRIADNGNIGIGTTTPNQRLTVQGNLNLSAAAGAIYFDDTRFLYASSTNHSIVFGENAGANFTTGDEYNVALGYYAGRLASGDHNVYAGTYAGQSSSGIHNYFVGYNAGYNNTGNVNTAFGPDAGYNNSGSNNFFFGDDAGYNNTGTENYIFGTNAGYNNTGNSNFIAGDSAGYDNSGFNNVLIGQLAGYDNSGVYSTLIGTGAGYGNSGSYNNIFGSNAGGFNSGSDSNLIGNNAGNLNSGSFSNIFGTNAGLNNSGGYNNLFGWSAGYNNTGEASNLIGGLAGYNNIGSYNDFIGYATGYDNTGSYNQLIGSRAGRFLQSTSTVAIGSEVLFGSHATNYLSSNNVAIGYRAGYASDDGSGNNILIGYQAADNLTTGNNNIVIGYDIDSVTATADNRLNIGNLIFGTGLDGTGTTLSSGNIGIGTSTPAQKLVVVGSTNTYGSFVSYTSGVTTVLSANAEGSYLEAQGANNLQFFTGGSNRLHITSTGNVGIGTTTPNRELTLVGKQDIYASNTHLRFFDTDSVGYSYLERNSLSLNFGNNNGVSSAIHMRITDTGNIGIGTTSPYAKLSVVGNSAFTGQLNLSGTAANIALGSNWLSGDGGDEGIFVDAAGNVGIGTNSPYTKLQIGEGTAVVIPDGGSGIFTPGLTVQELSGISGLSVGVLDGVQNRRAGLFVNNALSLWGLSSTYSGTEPDFVIVSGSDEALRITATGNVGIGTTSPYAKLSVAGDSAFTGQLNLSGSAANIALGSNWLSGDGDDEGVFVSSTGLVGIGDNTPNALLSIASVLSAGSLIEYFNEVGSIALTGSLTGMNLDLSGNFIATGQSVTGYNVMLPSVTNSGSGTYNYRGLVIGGGDLTQNTLSGNTAFNGVAVTNPNITQTTGSLSANGVLVTTGVNTTGGTQTGLNVVAQGVASGSLFGVNLSNFFIGGAGTERAINIGLGWDVPIHSINTGQSYFAGNLGLGHGNVVSAPDPISIYKNSGASANIVLRKGDSSDYASVIGQRARGSITSPTSLSAGDVIFALRAEGFAGGWGGSNAAVEFLATENYSSGVSGSAIGFKTRANSGGAYTERLRIDNNGNVGIGTTSPAAKFAVSGTALFSNTITQIGDTDIYRVGMFKTATGGAIEFGLLGQSITGMQAINNLGNFQSLVMQPNGGSVGIGASDPASKLEVTGEFNVRTGKTTNDYGILFNGNVSGYSTINSYRAGVGTANLILNSGGGNVGIGTTTPGARLAVSGGSIALDNAQPIIFANANGAYSWHTISADSSNRLNITSNNANITLVGSSGNVGIGTTTPAAKLDVFGQAFFGSGVTKLKTYSDSTYSGIYNGASLTSAESIYMGGGGQFFYAGGLERMRIATGGNVGIGTSTPLQKLQVFGDIRVGTSGSNGCIEDYGGGVIGGTCSSDERLKENITGLASSTQRSYLEALTSLTPVTYTWNQDAAQRYGKSMNVANLGLIAQDVEDSFPELVSRNDDGFRQVDFRALPFYIIEAMKELWVKVRGIDERVEDLEQENEYLKSRLDEIEDELNVTPPPAPTPEPEPTPEEDPVPEPTPEPPPETPSESAAQ